MAIELKKPRWTILRPQTAVAPEELVRYDPADRSYLDPDKCFLCSRALTRTNRSVEHIFPKWLLNQFKLWDSELTLLNGSSIPYRSVRIPSCNKCNGVFLGALERRVERAVGAGYATVRKLPKAVLFQWLTKIYFQLLYLETRLAVDRRDSSKGTILTPKFLDEFGLEHLLLNSVRRPIHVGSPVPWSIFVLPAQTSSRVEHNFDFLDSLHQQVVAVRMGEVAIIAALMDSHVQEPMLAQYFNSLRKRIKLHPVQFRELVAKVVYKSHTMNHQPRFTTAWDQDGRFIQVVPHGVLSLSGRDLFRRWDQSEYAKILASYLHGILPIPPEGFFQPPDQALTFLRNDRNRFVNLPMDVKEFTAMFQTSNAEEQGGSDT